MIEFLISSLLIVHCNGQQTHRDKGMALAIRLKNGSIVGESVEVPQHSSIKLICDVFMPDGVENPQVHWI